MARLRKPRPWAPAESAWVALYGSERLKRCVAEGIPAAALYREERLAREEPAWRYVREGESVLNAMNPPLEAFDLLDDCRRLWPEAKLQYVERETAEGLVEAAYVCTRGREGRTILWFIELPRPEATRIGKE